MSCYVMLDTDLDSVNCNSTVWVKKERHYTLVHIFTKYSPILIYRKFAIELLLKIPPDHKRVSTLPVKC